MKSQRPIIHGRDHERGGADPVRTVWESDDTGAGGFTIDLSRFVVAEVFGFKHLWVGGHGPIDSGAGVTTVACPIAGVPASPLFQSVFYDYTVTPTLGSSTSAPRNVGVNFEAVDADVFVYGVQFYRADGNDDVDVRLWKTDDDTTILAEGSGTAVGPAWNELYFDTPFGPLENGASDRYVVAWHNPTSGDHKGASPANPLPLEPEPPVIARTDPGDTTPWRRQLTDDPLVMPGLATSVDYLVGPIFAPGGDVPSLYIVATAAEGTDSGVYVERCEYTVGEIQVYWSAAGATVAVHIIAVGGEA